MISRNSRYADCILYRDGREEFLSTRHRREIPPSPDDRFHKVEAGDRLDLLAARYLGDAKLWWLIADANGIGNPMELEVGRTLRVPMVSIR